MRANAPYYQPARCPDFNIMTKDPIEPWNERFTAVKTQAAPSDGIPLLTAILRYSHMAILRLNRHWKKNVAPVNKVKIAHDRTNVNVNLFSCGHP